MKICVVEPIGIPESEIRSGLAGHDIDVFDSRGWSDHELIARCVDADVIASTNRPISATVIDGSPDLGLIAVAFAGVDSVDADAAARRGIAVVNASGYANTAVAELVFGLMIALARHIPQVNASIRHGGTAQMGTELKGKTVGVIGVGAIGSEVLRLAGAFGMTAVGYDQGSSTPLLEIIAESDFVTLHVPLLPATRGMVDADILGAMKPTAYLINCARGPIVDADALEAALAANAIAGAALDVFDREPPLPENLPLLTFPNVIATPHIGFDTAEAVRAKGLMTVEHIQEYFATTVSTRPGS